MKPPAAPQPPKSLLRSMSDWGNSSLSPVGLATLLIPIHTQPVQPFPLLFVPVLLFSSYANLQGFKKDSAGLTAAASGTYALLALRRRNAGGFWKKFTIRGAVRGGAVALGVMNAVSCGWVYATADREKEKDERTNYPRWG